MSEVEVTPAAGGEGWRVAVLPEGTEHEVAVPGGMAARLGFGDDERALVEASFAFLLDREPASAILRRFSLEVIGRYFPEYESVVGGGR